LNVIASHGLNACVARPQPELEKTMALPAIDVTCPGCGTKFLGFPTKSFLGFQNVKCRKCSKDVVYPLTSGYRTLYRVIFALMVVLVVVSLSKGVVPVPGLLGIATVVALIQDSKIRKTTATPAIRRAT
jgi:ribosomal protein S27E